LPLVFFDLVQPSEDCLCIVLVETELRNRSSGTEAHVRRHPSAHQLRESFDSLSCQSLDPVHAGLKRESSRLGQFTLESFVF
jgi:hypothetical protein